MLHKTQAVVLSITKYSDKFSIVHLFTRDFGRVAYLIPRISSKRSKVNHLLFSPLSLLNVEVEHKPLRDVQKIKEAQRLQLLYDIGSDINKISISFFLSEFLTKVLRETDSNILLFEYLKNSIEVLDVAKEGLANFHVTFLLGLTRFLGLYPNFGDYNENCFFDIISANFTNTLPSHKYFLKGAECVFLNKLSRINYSNMHLFRLSRNNRNAIIDNLIIYYRVHVHDFSTLKSLDILSQLF